MVRSQFDLGSTSKILNLSLLRFNERSGSENIGINSQRQEQQLTRTCFIVFNAFLLWFLCVWVFWGGFMIPYQSSTCLFLKKKKNSSTCLFGNIQASQLPFCRLWLFIFLFILFAKIKIITVYFAPLFSIAYLQFCTVFIKSYNHNK